MNRATSATGWVRNPDGTLGWTWNPITGCLNHDNGMCKGGGFPCYAYKLANGRLKPLYLANHNLAPDSEREHWHTAVGDIDIRKVDPFYPRFWEERLMPLHIPRKADSPKKGIFVCDMSELFGDWIPQSWQEQVFNAIKANPDYRFYLLTKQPQNLIKFSPFPENCWVGVTATTANYAVAACYELQDIEAKVKFLSVEPLLAWVLSSQGAAYPALYQELVDAGINWLIIGQQTPVSAKTQPKIEWVREIVEAADKAGIPVFLKDNLKPLYIANTKAQGQICSDYILRQELPDEDNI